MQNGYYEDWIDEGLPVTIRFNNLSQGKYWSDWHFVVGAAYQVTSSGQFIGVKEPDNGQTNVGFNYFPFVPNQETKSFAKIYVN